MPDGGIGHVHLCRFVAVEAAAWNPRAIFKTALFNREQVKIWPVRITGAETDTAGVANKPAFRIADLQSQQRPVAAGIHRAMEVGRHSEGSEIHHGRNRHKGIAGGMRGHRISLGRDSLQTVRTVALRQHGHHLAQEMSDGGVFLKALRCFQRRITHIHAKEKTLLR